MKFSDMFGGQYIVRTQELSWARVLTGMICYVVDATDTELSLQLTEDCVPSGQVYRFDSRTDDQHWRDVTDLVLEANMLILPPDTSCSYNSAVSSNYRNFLGISGIAPLPGEDAVGNFCVIGEVQGNNTVFGRIGYFVAAYDDGWYLAYQGFCGYKGEGAPEKHPLRVLVLSGNRGFYPAEPIVRACSEAYEEDLLRSIQYSSKVRERTSDGRTMSQIASVSSRVKTINLGE